MAHLQIVPLGRYRPQRERLFFRHPLSTAPLLANNTQNARAAAAAAELCRLRAAVSPSSRAVGAAGAPTPTGRRARGSVGNSARARHLGSAPGALLIMTLRMAGRVRVGLACRAVIVAVMALLALLPGSVQGEQWHSAQVEEHSTSTWAPAAAPVK